MATVTVGCEVYDASSGIALKLDEELKGKGRFTSYK